MATQSISGRPGQALLNEQADQLEKLATLMLRADGRLHVLERAAECRAKAILTNTARQAMSNCAVEWRSRWT